LALGAVPILAVTGILVMSTASINHLIHKVNMASLFFPLCCLTITLWCQLYIASFSAGMGAVPWVVMSEVIRISKIIILNYDLIMPLIWKMPSVIADIPYQYQRKGWKHRYTCQLVWCMAMFLHFQLPYELEHLW